MSEEPLHAKPSSPESSRRRRIRSFVRRPGRMTAAQQAALSELLPRFEIGAERSDLRLAFERQAPLVVEIGFGNGDTLAAMARAERDCNFVGIEVHAPGVGRLLRSIDEFELDNVRIAMDDAVDVLRQRAQPESIAELRIFFPDPWPKKRHHKRRLIQADFLALATSRLETGGQLHIATDWQPYADWIVEHVEAVPELLLLGSPWVDRPVWRPETRFEARGTARGHAIRDLLARKQAC